MEKNFNLLRPFDLEAAKRGEEFCYVADGAPRIFIDGPDFLGKICVKDPCDGELILSHQDRYRMAPPAWVEEKPVYKGDVLYRHKFGWKLRVDGKSPYSAMGHGLIGIILECNQNSNHSIGEEGYCNIKHLTWEPPKMKREVNLLAFLDDQGSLRWIREELFTGGFVRIPSEDKIIVIENPVL